MTTPPIQTIQDWLACALSFDANHTDPHASTHNETLADFQSDAVTRALANIRQFGGTILADATGLGKTRMALAIARTLLQESPHKTVYICIPSRLQNSWQRAALTSGWQIPSELQFITHTQLSTHLPDLTTAPPAAILVDEAHHFHNPTSNRSKNLAKITAPITTNAPPILLLTATPICNSIWDLYNLLTLFLAEHDLRDHIGLNLRDAFTHAQSGQFDLTELAKILVIQRRAAPANTHFGTYPSLKLNVLTYDASPEERWFWQNLEHEIRQLSLTLIHNDWPRPLFQEFILKRWESGPESLAKTLQSLVDFHRRWLEAHHAGHTLSRPDFHQLFSENTREQTVFPFIYQESTAPTEKTTDFTPENTLKTIHKDLYQLENLFHRAQKLAHNNTGALSAITNLLDHLPSQKLLIFTSYQHTADAIYRAICAHRNPHARVGLVTGRHARATGLGKTSPQEILRRFAPIANDEPDLPSHQQLDVLVCTDCLSEGINLQDCNHVLLADLPYTPLRVEQRIGRLMRPTPSHRNVTVYLPRPADWNDTLGLRRRLTTKLDSAHSAGSHFQNASVLNTVTPKTHAIQPLAALTTLDRLAKNLNAQRFHDFNAQTPQFFAASPHATQYHPHTQLWLRAVLEGTPHPIWLWCKIDHTQTTEMRTTHLISDFLKLADLRLEITPAQPDAHLLAAATKALETRLHHLQAARFAPMPLDHDSIQQKIWHQLSTWLRQSQPTTQTHDIDHLRLRILQPFPRGIERTLSDLLAKNPQPDQLFQSIHRLELPPPPKPMKLRIVLGLQINPSP